MSLRAGQRRGCARRQGGFSLVAAIFLIVVLAALGAFAVQIAMTQYQAASVEMLEARTQAAAAAGIEYGANMALQRATCAGTKTLNLTQAALKGFVVTVTCNATTHQVAGQNYQVYALTAAATNSSYGEPEYVARNVTGNVSNAPP
jgi:MSHA biogenesis protein MshP